jgi:hypothetical protein
MGRNNQQRRAAKKRARGRATGTSPGRQATPPSVADLAELAITLFAQGSEQEAGRVVDTMLVMWPAEAVATYVDVLTAVTIASLWDSGWQPVDVVRIVERKVDAAAAAATVEGVAVDAERYRHAPEPESVWMAQLDRIGANRPGRRLTSQVGAGADAWDAVVPALAALALLTRLSPLPKLLPPPDEWSRRARLTRSRAGVDPKILDRVRALLAKAESTQFPEEAGAFTAKAQELITRHALDRVLLEPDGGGNEEPIARRVVIGGPYVDAKAVLLHVIAGANRCRSVLHSELDFASVFGYADDLDAVELLFASLLVQATGAVTAMGPQRDERGRSRTRSFRQSFFYGFTDKIGQRLTTAAQQVTTEMTAENDRLLPALAARDHKVDEAFDAAIPHRRVTGGSVSNGAGYVAGQAAGEVASLDIRPHLRDRAGQNSFGARGSTPRRAS